MFYPIRFLSLSNIIFNYIFVLTVDVKFRIELAGRNRGDEDECQYIHLRTCTGNKHSDTQVKDELSIFKSFSVNIAYLSIGRSVPFYRQAGGDRIVEWLRLAVIAVGPPRSMACLEVGFLRLDLFSLV